MSWHSLLSTFMPANIFFGWRNAAEIILFSTLIYYFSLWLKQDKQKNLLFNFYGYCGILLGSYYLQLPTVTYLLFITAPIAVMLFILFHQDVLQKNFVTLRNIMPARMGDADWLETLVRSCLVAANNNKEIYCVIEHKDSLVTLLNTPLALYTDIQKNVLSMMLESVTFEQHNMLWVNSTGRLLGINATWNNSLHDTPNAESVKDMLPWQQDALFFTAKTDAVVFSINPIKRTFSIVTQGKTFNDIPAPHALKTIQKYLITPTVSQHKEIIHEAQRKNNNNKQHSA
ncbi:MAG: hypothetical protein NTX86_01440 [Candidatus Dependentiae bacterium]|nr:hypothetical protein [Candidatus Dependentiae bacterium]